MLHCRPWLLILQMEMNTSYYYHTVFAFGLCGILTPAKLLCVSHYGALNSTMLCLYLYSTCPYVTSAVPGDMASKRQGTEVITHLLVFTLFSSLISFFTM